MIDYTIILSTKYIGSEWTLDGNSYEGLTWLSNTPKPTKEELDAQWDEVLSIKKKEQCKTQAKTLLAKSDWSVLPDRAVMLENATEFVAYRTELLKLIISPVAEPVWPSEPEPRWKEL